VVELLLAAGASPNTRDDEGWTSLHAATTAADCAVLRLLLTHPNPDVDAGNNDEERPLHIAARFGSAEAIGLLLAAGADVNAATQDACTPLHECGALQGVEARRLAGLEALRALLAAGASPHVRNKNGRQPLHSMVQFGTPAGVRLLLEAGADVEAEDLDGDRPLHLAAGPEDQLAWLDASTWDPAVDAADLPDMVAALVAGGARLDVENGRGLAPLGLAVEQQMERCTTRATMLEVIMRLLRAGARWYGASAVTRGTPTLTSTPPENVRSFHPHPGYPGLIRLLGPVLDSCPAALPALALRFHEADLAAARAALLVLRLRTPLHDPGLHMRILGAAFA